MDRTGLSNVVLIGMPASGKTSLGHKLARKTGWPIHDCDDVIAERFGSIKEIFASHGEEYFRQQEAVILKETADLRSTIIATGGGAVLHEEEMNLVREHSLVIWLQRDYDLIKVDDSRPLINRREVWMDLYQQRYGLYEKYCDEAVTNNTTFKYALGEIISLMKEYGLL